MHIAKPETPLCCPIHKLIPLIKEILEILMRDATIPYTDIAKRLKVSSGTVHVRMKKLTQLGIIRSVNLHVNPEKLGFDITAFSGSISGEEFYV